MPEHPKVAFKTRLVELLEVLYRDTLLAWRPLTRKESGAFVDRLLVDILGFTKNCFAETRDVPFGRMQAVRKQNAEILLANAMRIW